MTEPADSLYSKENPFPAILRENRMLNKSGSGKDTRHLVVDIGGSGLAYCSGDSLGVYPKNPPAAVEAILRAMDCRGDEPVPGRVEGQTVPFREALSSGYTLSGPSRKFLQAVADKATDSEEKEALKKIQEPEQREACREFLENREFIDFLEEFPSARFTPEELVGHMKKLSPRLYSIASSPAKYPEEVHLTVAVVRYVTNGRKRSGVCSTFLADRVPVGEAGLPVFVSSSHFRMPEDGNTDLIMVGPGTGVAPFRAFLQEREATGAKGRNWLFFGDQRRATDFLYEEEFFVWQRDGCLHRLSTAFSRDQSFKIYVQDRMREQGAELWSWLQGGAALYVCGDASRMAKDVDLALHDIVEKHGGKTPAEAKEWVRQLKKDKRYQRDVY